MSKLRFPNKPVIAVDWDGVCVELTYPLESDWLPGAKEALKALTRKYKVYIHTSRIAPVTYEAWDVPLSTSEIDREVNYIRRMLDEAGLKSVGIWDAPFKVPAVAYIDDRAIRFTDWDQALSDLTTVTGVPIKVRTPKEADDSRGTSLVR